LAGWLSTAKPANGPPRNGDGNPLAVMSTETGLEIRHAAADRRPAADERRIAAQLAPGHGVAAPDQRTPSALRALQGLLDRHYARRS
jgi:hypothetical protein